MKTKNTHVHIQIFADKWKGFENTNVRQGQTTRFSCILTLALQAPNEYMNSRISLQDVAAFTAARYRNRFCANLPASFWRGVSQPLCDAISLSPSWPTSRSFPRYLPFQYSFSPVSFQFHCYMFSTGDDLQEGEWNVTLDAENSLENG